MPEFSIRADELNPTTVVLALQGEVDLSNAPAFQELLTTRIGLGARRVIIDLQEATFLDSTALRVLLASNRELAALGGQLSIVCPDPRIRKIFTVTGLDKFFPFHTTLAQAVAEAGSSEAFDAVA